MNRTIIILGHGSRSTEASQQFMQIVNSLQDLMVEDTILPAFMELAEPRLKEAITKAITMGATDILVIPCFLFQGIHIKEDIPEMLEVIKTVHPDVSVRFGRPIGADPRIVAILAERVKEIS